MRQQLTPKKSFSWYMNQATTIHTPTRFQGRSSIHAKKSLPPGTGLDAVLAELTEEALSFVVALGVSLNTDGALTAS